MSCQILFQFELCNLAIEYFAIELPAINVLSWKYIKCFAIRETEALIIYSFSMYIVKGDVNLI